MAAPRFLRPASQRKLRNENPFARRAGELLKEFDGRGEHRKSGGTPTSSQRQAAACG